MTVILETSTIKDYKKQTNTSKYCICKTLSPCLTFIKLFGYFPATWRHEDKKCIYEKSFFWLIYTGFILTLQIYAILMNVKYTDLIIKKPLLTILDELTNMAYSHYVVFITLLGLFKYSSFINTLNKLAVTINEGEFCQSAMRRVILLQYAIFASLALALATQTGIYIWIIYFSKYEHHLTVINIFYRMFTSFCFGFYAILFTLFALVIGALACFEKFALSCLNYIPVHPLKDIDESNNDSDFMGLIHYKLCTENHTSIGKMQGMKPAVIVENLRIYHEEFSLCIYSWNKSMDIHFLVHTIVELSILIVDWYAVIAYFVYNFKDPEAPTIHIFNMIFVLSHTYGLFLFLKNCQQLKNMIHGLISFLLEYSTRITDPEEHQQVRLFIEKIVHHRSFTASGVFTIDLGIAGPISANLLTYVLVALQFEVPKE